VTFSIVTNAQLLVAIQALQARMLAMERVILMSESTTQSDVNNVASVLQAFATDAQTDFTTIQNALTTLSQQVANGQPIDTSQLDAASAAVSSVQTALDNLAQSATTAANPPTAPVTPPTA
jgi:cob(I)alamin adenosyltransferase